MIFPPCIKKKKVSFRMSNIYIKCFWKLYILKIIFIFLEKTKKHFQSFFAYFDENIFENSKIKIWKFQNYKKQLFFSFCFHVRLHHRYKIKRFEYSDFQAKTTYHNLKLNIPKLSKVFLRLKARLSVSYFYNVDSFKVKWRSKIGISHRNFFFFQINVASSYVWNSDKNSSEKKVGIF